MKQIYRYKHMYKHERTCIGKFIKGIFQRRINHKTVYKNTIIKLYIKTPGTKNVKVDKML